MTIPEISKLEGLSATHVAKLLMILRKGGFITSTRGQAGGYALARAASDIAVSDVLAELGGRLYDAEFCGRHSGLLGSCSHGLDCSVKGLWHTIQEAVDGVLKGLTIADMMDKTSQPIQVQLIPSSRRA